MKRIFPLLAAAYLMSDLELSLQSVLIIATIIGKTKSADECKTAAMFRFFVDRPISVLHGTLLINQVFYRYRLEIVNKLIVYRRP